MIRHIFWEIWEIFTLDPISQNMYQITILELYPSKEKMSRIVFCTKQRLDSTWKTFWYWATFTQLHFYDVCIQFFFHELKKMTFHKYWQITIGHQRGSLWRVKSKHQLVFQTCSCIGSALWAFVIKQNILWNAINHISW